ncbi:MAG: hypothetical protein HN348_32440 [Proteobacteria bacterium]|nr:hypothetical protein [Pseudomonadota bacterium]
MPFPLIIGGFAHFLFQAVAQTSTKRAGWLAVAIFGTLFMCLPFRWTISPSNWATLGFPDLKVGAGYAVAEAVNEVTPPGGMVLAPTGVAIWLATQPKHPAIVGFRYRHWSPIYAVYGAGEVQQRRAMLEMISGLRGAEQHFDLTVDELERRKIAVVVVPHQLPWRDRMEKALRERGYQLVRDVDTGVDQTYRPGVPLIKFDWAASPAAGIPPGYSVVRLGYSIWSRPDSSPTR